MYNNIQFLEIYSDAYYKEHSAPWHIEIETKNWTNISSHTATVAGDGIWIFGGRVSQHKRNGILFYLNLKPITIAVTRSEQHFVNGATINFKSYVKSLKLTQVIFF